MSSESNGSFDTHEAFMFLYNCFFRLPELFIDFMDDVRYSTFAHSRPE